jgi:hypothetical protein
MQLTRRTFIQTLAALAVCVLVMAHAEAGDSQTTQRPDYPAIVKAYADFMIAHGSILDTHQ